MAFVLLAHTAKGGSTTAVTTDAIDTTGANLIVAALSYYPAGGASNFSDSKGNTWTTLTRREPSVGGVIVYCLAPTVGSGHTFTSNNNDYPNVAAAAFSGALAASAFDQQGGATGGTSDTTIQPGSVTPSEGNELVITGAAIGTTAGAVSVDSGFTKTDDAYGAAFGVALAYLIQTSAVAKNPTWTIPAGAFSCAAEAATFKAAAGAPALSYDFLQAQPPAARSPLRVIPY